jgi:serine/threonine-protein kinase SRPK3
VHIGEVMIDRYVVVQKLGWGHFSTVWLARDMKFNSYVALKVQKSASHYQEAAYDEVEILDVVARNAFQEQWVKGVEKLKEQDEEFKEKGGYTIEDCHTVQLLNSFLHSGPNGQHFVMVFEILGVNLLEIMKRYDYKGIPLPLVRRMAKQILIGLDYLHRVCRIIHTDLKPENVIVSLTKAELAEIMNRGQISTMNKNVKTQNVFEDGTLFRKVESQPQTLLGNVDTTGMSK